ncbi:MAG: hypothetical protein LAT62_07905 [Natronospirillum sp.]|uniref:M14 family metallopeptidase n=1 Tax=Natronospirillum sp. TaxID=2812955 RepID=UPI0025D42828|nr:M14-type cytosolic carboxypeptidase [Natronospirillum sp.]MCH8551844.1 hypothetical protein [Natronospirillum sp.]
MRISSAFDSGNIEVVKAEDPNDIQLNIRKDHQSDFYQWFHFRLCGQPGETHRLRIMNAGNAAYPKGWENYRAVASYDRDTWFRVDTVFENGELVITHLLEHDIIYFAYFVPYSYEQHQDLVQEAQQSHLCRVEDLGTTLDGRDMSLLVIGDEENAKHRIWITARQHPGETMAEWFVEGFLERLLDTDDATARELLADAVFYVVPNMNPDGSVRGHLRTNAAGVNLNREWQNPSLEKSPEVYRVRQKMEATGVDLFLDIHGDEAIPYNFLADTSGVPTFHEGIQQLQQRFQSAFLAATPEYQTRYGYPKDAPGQANLTLGCTWVGNHFNCLAYTLEMPFKDNDDLPDELYGWSEVRSMQLGRDIMPAIRAVLPDLR